MKQGVRRDGPGHAFVGLFFVLFGLMFLLGNMGYFDIEYAFRSFWPILLIFFGVLMLIRRQEDYRYGYRYRRRNSGFVWLFLGLFFLLNSTNVIRVGFGHIWPFFFMMIGVMMLWRMFDHSGYAWHADDRDRYDRDSTNAGSPPGAGAGEAGSSASNSAADPASGTDSNSTMSGVAILGRVVRRSNSQNFKGGDFSAFMGGCEVDLRAASPAGGQAVVDVFAVWGGIEIRVPPDWTVVDRVNPIMAGFEDTTESPKDTSKKLILRGTVLMGGIEVRN